MMDLDDSGVDSSDSFSEGSGADKSTFDNSSSTAMDGGGFETRPPAMRTTSQFVYAPPTMTLFGYINPVAKPQFNYSVDDGASCILRTQAFRKTWAHLSRFIEEHITQAVNPGVEKVLEFINKFACASFLELPTILSLAGTNTSDHDYVFSILARACESRIVGGKFAVLNTKQCPSVASAITQIHRQFAGLEEIEQQEVAAYAAGVGGDSDSEESRIGDDEGLQFGVEDLSHIARVALSAKVHRTVTPEQLCEWYTEERDKRKKLEQNAQQSHSQRQSQELSDLRAPYVRTRKNTYRTEPSRAGAAPASTMCLPSKFPLVVLIEDAECFPPSILGGILEIASHLRFDEGLPMAFVLGVSTSPRFVESLCEPETYRRLYIQAVELLNSKDVCEGLLDALLFDPTLLPFSVNSTALKTLYDIFNQYNKCIAALVKALYRICQDFYNEKLFSFLARPISDLASPLAPSAAATHPLTSDCSKSETITSTQPSCKHMTDDYQWQSSNFCVRWSPSFSMSDFFQKLILLSFGSQLTAEHFDYIVSKYQHLTVNSDGPSEECCTRREQTCMSQKWLNPHPLQPIMDLNMDSPHSLECRNMVLCSQILPKAMLELVERQLAFFVGLRLIEATNEQGDVPTKLNRIVDLMSKAENLQADLGSRKKIQGISIRSNAMKKIHLAERHFHQEICSACLRLQDNVNKNGSTFLLSALCTFRKILSQVYPLLDHVETFRSQISKDEEQEGDTSGVTGVENAAKEKERPDKKPEKATSNKVNMKNVMEASAAISSSDGLGGVQSKNVLLSSVSYFSLLESLICLQDNLSMVHPAPSPGVSENVNLSNSRRITTSASGNARRPIEEAISFGSDGISFSAMQRLILPAPNDGKHLTLQMLRDRASSWLGACLTKLLIPLPHAHPLAGDLILWGKSSSIGTWLENNLYPSSVNRILTQMAFCQQEKGAGRSLVLQCECCTAASANKAPLNEANNSTEAIFERKSELTMSSRSTVEVNPRYDTFPTMEDLTIMYRLYERGGRSIDLWDWFCAFCKEVLKPHPANPKPPRGGSRSLLLRRPDLLQHLRLRFGLAVGTFAVIFGIIKIPNSANYSEQHTYWEDDDTNELDATDPANEKRNGEQNSGATTDKTSADFGGEQMSHTAQMIKKELKGGTVKKLLWGKVWYCGEVFERELAQVQTCTKKRDKTKKTKK